MYLRDRKIGWEQFALKHVRESDGSVKHYRIDQEMYFRLPAGGTVIESTMSFSLDFSKALEPLAFRFSLKAPTMTAEGTGEVRDGVLIIRKKTPFDEQEERIKLDQDMDIYGLSQLRRAVEGFKVGDIVEGRVYEPSFIGVVPYRFEVYDSAVIRSGDSSAVVFKVHAEAGGLKSEMILDEQGRVIRSEGDMGITMKREDERTAKNLDASMNLTDFYLAFAIPIDTVCADPASIRRAVFQLQGTGAYRFDEGGTQTADRTGRVTVDLDAPQAKDPGADTYLRPSASIQSGDERIVEKAREVTRGARSAKEKAGKIYEWVYRNVKKEPTFIIPTALDVLGTMRGDCNEHAALFCGLARAAGVPARVAVGVVCLGDRFYYHAWNEVYIDGRWLPVDATLGQNPASAMRIRFETGELADQVRIASLAGKISISVREMVSSGK